jgi:hypothetical protein
MPDQRGRVGTAEELILPAASISQPSPIRMECHARRPDGTQDYVNSWGKGGYEFKDVWGAEIAATAAPSSRRWRATSTSAK